MSTRKHGINVQYIYDIVRTFSVNYNVIIFWLFYTFWVFTPTNEKESFLSSRVGWWTKAPSQIQVERMPQVPGSNPAWGMYIKT